MHASNYLFNTQLNISFKKIGDLIEYDWIVELVETSNDLNSLFFFKIDVLRYS